MRYLFVRWVRYVWVGVWTKCYSFRLDWGGMGDWQRLLAGTCGVRGGIKGGWKVKVWDERESDGRTTTYYLPLLTTYQGLEWSHVFFIRVNEGDSPIAGTHGAGLEEERRLAFVAMTRAKVRWGNISIRCRVRMDLNTTQHALPHILASSATNLPIISRSSPAHLLVVSRSLAGSCAHRIGSFSPMWRQRHPGKPLSLPASALRSGRTASSASSNMSSITLLCGRKQLVCMAIAPSGPCERRRAWKCVCRGSRHLQAGSDFWVRGHFALPGRRAGPTHL